MSVLVWTILNWGVTKIKGMPCTVRSAMGKLRNACENWIADSNSSPIASKDITLSNNKKNLCWGGIIFVYMSKSPFMTRYKDVSDIQLSANARENTLPDA